MQYSLPPILELILFNIFIYNLDDDAECTCWKFADDTESERVADTSVDCATIQRVLSKLEIWANRKLTELNKELQNPAPREEKLLASVNAGG